MSKLNSLERSMRHYEYLESEMERVEKIEAKLLRKMRRKHGNPKK